MSKWYEEAHIDQRVWLLDHLGTLKLSADEALVALELVHFNALKRNISLEALAYYSGLSTEKIDKAMAGLSRSICRARFCNNAVRMHSSSVRRCTSGKTVESVCA